MLSRFLQQAALLIFLVISAEALLFTLTGIALPPIPLVHWSFGMMAPYQGDTAWNDDFVYEGARDDGVWERIDVLALLPYSPGEANARMYLRTYGDFRSPRAQERFGDFAAQVLQKNPHYHTVRVWHESWPRSPAGFDFLRRPAFLTRELITQVQ